jgi:hypothetical protein
LRAIPCHTMATVVCGRGKSGASYQRLGNIKRRAYWDSRRKKIRTVWRQHDGDCALCSGKVRGFVSTLRKTSNNGRIGTVYRKKIRTVWRQTRRHVICHLSFVICHPLRPASAATSLHPSHAVFASRMQTTTTKKRRT